MILPAIMGATGAWWTPKKITTALWLDAADSDTITLDGSSNVEQWDDKSGNGRHIGQSASGNRPGYNSTDEYLDFSATTAYLFNTSPFLYNSGACAIYSVFDVTASTDARSIAEGSSSSQRPVYCSLQSHGITATRGTTFIRNDADNIVVVQDDLNYPDMFGGKHLRGWHDSGTSIVMAKDASWGSDVSYTRVGTLTLNRFCVGGLLRASFAVPMNFLAHEIVILATVPSIADRQKIEGYLAHKWGLTANLPSGHPYKSRRPRG